MTTVDAVAAMFDVVVVTTVDAVVAVVMKLNTAGAGVVVVKKKAGTAGVATTGVVAATMVEGACAPNDGATTGSVR